MRRREFITLLGGAAAAWPLAARAQQAAMPVIGFLGSQSRWRSCTLLTAFRQGLRTKPAMSRARMSRSSIAGRTVPTRPTAGAGGRTGSPSGGGDRCADTPTCVRGQGGDHDDPDRLPSGDDPVKLGLVASLNRPGGNVTGVNFVTVELGAKRLELLRELQPEAVRVGVLVNPNYPSLSPCGRSGCGRPSGSKSKSSKPAPAARSIRPSRALRKSRLMRSWSAPTRSSTTGASNSLP